MRDAERSLVAPECALFACNFRDQYSEGAKRGTSRSPVAPKCVLVLLVAMYLGGGRAREWATSENRGCEKENKVLTSERLDRVVWATSGSRHT